MLQSIISLEDKDINLVLDAVTTWCSSHGVPVDSAEGRRAITLAVDLVTSHGAANLLHEISQRFDQPDQSQSSLA